MNALKHIGLVLLVSGCAHTEVETYPQSWPPAANVVAGSCPDISGQYGFVDPARYRDFSEERALRILNEVAGFQRILPVPNRVAISHNGDKWFRIETFVENNLERTREFTGANATIRCGSYGLFLKPPPLEQKVNGGSQTIRRELVFNVAEDGSLVFREEYTATSRILLAPVAGSGIRWSRLTRIRP
jgi:hypothetical protein